MALGPGKYDALATLVREQSRARGVVVIVIDGEHGSGFSVQAGLQDTLALPQLLRHLADQVETAP